MSLLFAKISLDTPANLFEREFNSSSTTADSSAGAEASVVVCNLSINRTWLGKKVSKLTELTDWRLLFGELNVGLDAIMMCAVVI